MTFPLIVSVPGDTQDQTKLPYEIQQDIREELQALKGHVGQKKGHKVLTVTMEDSLTPSLTSTEAPAGATNSGFKK